MGAPQYEQAGADIGGTGTTNTIPRWTGASTLGDSIITQSGSFIGIGLGAAAPLATVHTLNAVGAIGASPNWMSSFDTSGNYRSGLAFAFSVTPAASKVAVQVSSNGTGGVVNAIVAQGDGSVGIGTASPGFKFVVADTVAGVVTSEIRNDSTNSAATARLRFTTQGGESWIEAFRNAGGALTFATLSTERARIDSAGRWLVGTSTAASGPAITAVISSPTAGGQQWHIAAGSPGGVALVPTPSTATWYVYSNALGSESYQQSCKMTATGIDLTGAATPGLKLPATPGNTDPNTLDCYADGGTANSGGVTWTPTLAFGGNSTGITYTTQVGRYTRIGNTIVAHAYIKISSKGTSTGDATIGGLPTSSNTTGVYPSAAIGFTASITFANQMFARMNPNSTSVFLTETTGAGTVSALNDTDFNNSSEIAFTICYPVT